MITKRNSFQTENLIGIADMVLSVLLHLIYPPPASVLITAMSVMSFISLGNGGWMESKGKNIKYSKFKQQSSSSSDDNQMKKKPEVPSKFGMLVIYGPAFLAGVSSLFLFPVGLAGEDLRFTLVRSTLTIHFLKRLLEVLFLHKYSGSMEVETMTTISLSYFLATATMTYTQYLAQPLSEPAIDLKYIGIPMFLLGICGNFYHHYLLTMLRKEGDNKYKIPQGGLFGLVICPHYSFEILAFFGISCISQTLYAFCYTMGSTFYLMGRSYATREWYKSKFEEFPEHVKALIPYIF